MRQHLRICFLATVFAGPYSVHAQWCVPASAIPYNTEMPGVTHVAVGSIDRTSADIENYPNNSYVNTGLTTTLEKGTTHPITIGFTIDAVFFPGTHMNLRVWVDLNQDGQLDDPGETLLSVDHTPPPTYTGSIVVPSSAMNGSTRMRVTAKMCDHAGHSLPTPCDQPADPLGYHGEIEDYTVVIAEANGIGEGIGNIASLSVAPVPLEATSMILLGTTAADIVTFELMDATGRIIVSERKQLPPGEHVIPMAFDQAVNAGTYVLRATSGSGVRTIPVVKR